METLSLVLFSLAVAFYALSVTCVLRLVREVNQSSAPHKVSIWTWYRGWKTHKALFPGSRLRARLLMCGAATVGLGLAVFLIQAGARSPSTNNDQAVTLPSGRVIKIQQIWEQSVFQEPPALMLDYGTNLKIADNAALRSEADEVWSVFFKQKAEERHFTKAVVTAHESSKEWSLMRPLGYRFTYAKQADGGWTRSERQK